MMEYILLYVIPIAFFVLFFEHGVMLIVKIYRCHKWFEAHDGVKIGSVEWMNWCHDNGIKTSYFL